LIIINLKIGKHQLHCKTALATQSASWSIQTPACLMQIDLWHSFLQVFYGSPFLDFLLSHLHTLTA